MYDMQVVIVCDALETYSDDGLLREKLVEWTPKTDSSKKKTQWHLQYNITHYCTHLHKSLVQHSL